MFGTVKESDVAPTPYPIFAVSCVRGAEGLPSGYPWRCSVPPPVSRASSPCGEQLDDPLSGEKFSNMSRRLRMCAMAHKDVSFRKVLPGMFPYVAASGAVVGCAG